MGRIMNNICSVLLLETGVAVFDDRDNLVFSKKFDNPINSYRSLKGGERSPEFDQLRQILQSFDFISVNDPSIMFLLRQSGLNSQVMPEDQQRQIRDEKPALMVKSKLASNEIEAMQKLRNFAVEFSSTRVKEASEKLDLHITQAISALDELDKLINVISTRMREWYGLHFPELDNLIQSPNLYAEIVANAGLRQNITRQILEQAGLHDRKVDIILDAAKRIISTFLSCNPACSRICLVMFCLKPALATISAYKFGLWIKLSSSGKCKPYHSRILVDITLINLSSSSSALIACVICRSSFSEASFILDDENSTAKFLSFCMASISLLASLDFTIKAGFSSLICLC